MILSRLESTDGVSEEVMKRWRFESFRANQDARGEIGKRTTQQECNMHDKFTIVRFPHIQYDVVSPRLRDVFPPSKPP